MATSSTQQQPMPVEALAFPTAPQPATAPASPKKGKLRFADVASLFVRLRRFSTRAGVTPRSSEATSEHQDASGSQRPAPAPLTISSPSTTSPRSRIKIRGRRSDSLSPVGPYAYTRRVSAPKVFKPNKRGHVSSSSGPEPKTHSSLQGVPLQDIAIPGLVAPEDVQNNNTNTLGAQAVESWDVYECVGAVNLVLLLSHTRKALLDYVKALGANVLVEEQWHSTMCGPKNGVYRVQIRYSAVPKQSRKPDPGRPVALDQAKGVPGLMSILKRNGE